MVFHSAGNCKAELYVPKSCRRHIKKQLRSKKALKGGLGEVLKNGGVSIVYVVIT